MFSVFFSLGCCLPLMWVCVGVAGLHCECVYQLSGVESKAHLLRHHYNTGEVVSQALEHQQEGTSHHHFTTQILSQVLCSVLCVLCVYLVVIYRRGVISWYPVSISTIQFLLKSMDSFGFHNFFTKLVPFIYNSIKSLIPWIILVIIFVLFLALIFNLSFSISVCVWAEREREREFSHRILKCFIYMLF